jgi:hypothetical protein
MAGNNFPVDPEGKGIGSLVGKVIKRATPVLRIGSSLYDAYTALPQEIKDKVRDSILPPPDQETVGPSSFPPIEIDYSGIRDMEQGNSISIYPKNQKKFAQEGVLQPGGGYLNPQTQENLTGKNASAGIISINREKGTGSLKIHPETTDVVGSPNEQGATVIRTNLFNKKAGWKWINSPEGYENATSLISVENKGQHHYTLKTLFPNGVNLASYPNSKTEPRLRPTVQKGFVSLGDVVGKVLIRGKEHPVYNTISAFAQGGLVDKPLYPR